MDVGGKNSYRLSPIYYTSIADIKAFRFRLKRSFPPKEIIKRMRHQVPGGPAPKSTAPFVGGADHRSDGLTLPEARRYLSRARGGVGTGILPQRPNCRNPNSLGPMLASRLWLFAATCPGRVLARDPFGRLLHQLQCATFFCCRSLSLTGS